MYKAPYCAVTVALLASALLLAACGGDESNDQSATDGPTPRVVELEIRGLSFSPDTIDGGQIGQLLEVRIVNDSDTLHTFTIDEFNVDVEIPADGETTIPVLPPETGEFNFYCRFHNDSGMFGSIKVSARAD